MRGVTVLLTVAAALFSAGAAMAAETNIPQVATTWTQTGWGGGGFFYAAAFHPTRDGVIYLAGDVAGVYKSEDHGQHFRMINSGLAAYGVFSLAVDPSSPDTVYAATDGGLCKSTDAGEHWTTLPDTGRSALRITGEKGKSIRCIAVDPTNSNIVYAASPAGKVYKSIDGGNTWAVSYQKAADQVANDTIQVQFGKVNDNYHGGFWMPLAFPKGADATDCAGFGFSFQGGKVQPRDMIVTLKTASGASYRSKNISQIFKQYKNEMADVVLAAADFSLDPEYTKKNPEKATAAPSTPDWATVDRVDVVCVGDLPTSAATARFGKFYFVMNRMPGIEGGAKRVLLTARSFAKDKALNSYGNFRVLAAGQAVAADIYSIAVSPKEPSMVIAATADVGLIMSTDAGATWRELNTPKRATNVAFAGSDANLIYGCFFDEGVYKSTDKGQTWAKASTGMPEKYAVRELVISPKNPQDLYAIAVQGWSGKFFYSSDGGGSWTESSTLVHDFDANPTLPQDQRKNSFSAPTNLAMNPNNPSELFISANWRSGWSGDAGKNWIERDRGADISCVYEVRFSGNRVYACAMDEGTLASDDNGKSWYQLWPLKWDKEISGHNWRLAINNINGVDRVLATDSPWDSNSNRVIRSEDGGKTYTMTTEGLPDYYPTGNTMWEKGYARALAVDPKNPEIVYLGIDGNPAPGKMGGGVFKSTNGGKTWKQLETQPGSRRMFFGLAVDPTDSNRIYWAGCGEKGGLYRSDDAGKSWQYVFTNQSEWLFNVLVSPDGTVYAPGRNLWRSTDHGATWKQISNFPTSRQMVGLEMHPKDPKTLWVSTSTKDSIGAVYKTTDGGATWAEITGDLPCRNPMVLRYNPQTNELWAAGVGICRVPQ